MNSSRKILSTTLIGTAFLLAGCEKQSPALLSDYCIPVADGEVYQVVNGRLVPVDVASDEGRNGGVSYSEQTINGWLASGGFDWLKVRARGNFAILTGTAPGDVAKEAGIGAALASIRNVEESAYWVPVDAIVSPGDESPVGLAAERLAVQPEIMACNDAFSETLSDRTIRFNGQTAKLSEGNNRTLRALAAVAALCQEYRVEIGAHTGLQGSEEANSVLSQSRADAVRNRLIDFGVNGAILRAVGYGESLPLDPRSNSVANAVNNRVELRVSVR